MKALRLFAFALSLLALSTSCARIAIHFESDESRERRLAPIPTRASPEQEKPKIVAGRTLATRSYSVGLWGAKTFSSPLNLSQECPEGWGDLTTRVTGVQGLLRVVTLNLYSPWTVDLSCRATTEKPVDY